MVRAKPTSMAAATRQRSLPSRTNRQKKFLRLACRVTQAEKSGTTSGAESTGAMTSDAPTVTRRTRTSPARTWRARTSRLLDDTHVEGQRSAALCELSQRGQAAVL